MRGREQITDSRIGRGNQIEIEVVARVGPTVRGRGFGNAMARPGEGSHLLYL